MNLVGNRFYDLRVETAGADFVFETGYELRSLSELRHFIEKNGHLPGVQSAAEMQEKGVSVSELVTTLLQKIEELTLIRLSRASKSRLCRRNWQKRRAYEKGGKRLANGYVRVGRGTGSGEDGIEKWSGYANFSRISTDKTLFGSNRKIRDKDV